ncbi:putative DNA-binding transcriptional regulator YafY [Glycomyces artemisiae]|uniref:Putative DNA-binding transcriptional regulator YafY n=1 Tax=Glycomyces artemisiae TaxID=1076443 RepID=A0A2T0UEU4_9ACTN|nr:YafY family protein [Glycomyces artemisiae]PRY56394.1 putative DNA-binding transcriptional regulator YafY [Glycomyces artemisiae]
MLETSARLLRLLALLQARRDRTGPDLAERLGVSTRTVRADVDKLRQLGYRVASTTGSAGGYRLEAGSELPPLLLDDEEAVAVALGLRAAASGSVAGIEETSLRALAKLEQTMPSRLRRRIEVLRSATAAATAAGPAVDAEVLTSIAEAAHRCEQLRFDYLDRAGEETRRRAEPHRLVYTGRRWYLLAWDVDRGDWRTFRADRIRPRIPNGPRFAPREPPEGAVDHVLKGIGRTAWEHRARVRFHVPLEAAAERLPIGSGVLEAAGADACLWETGSDSLEDLARFTAGLGLPFSVEAPQELREELRRLAERLRAALSGGPRELREEPGEGLPLGGGEGLQEPRLVREVHAHEPVGHLLPLARQGDLTAARVLVGHRPLHEALRFEPVDALGDRAGGDEHRAREVARRERVRLPGAAQRREDVEVAVAEPGLGEGRAQLPVEAVGEAEQAAHHQHRGGVEVGALAVPLGDHVGDGVVPVVRHGLHSTFQGR